MFWTEQAGRLRGCQISRTLLQWFCEFNVSISESPTGREAGLPAIKTLGFLLSNDFNRTTLGDQHGTLLAAASALGPSPGS